MSLALRLLVLAGVLVLAPACGGKEGPPAPPPLADMGESPQAREADEAPVRYTPPAGIWRVSSDTPAPGQWFESYVSEDGAARMTVLVFPLRDTTDVNAVFSQALDTYLRGRGTDGFGLAGLRTRTTWGAPAAQSSFTAVVDGQTVAGEACLLHASPKRWALAVGHAPGTSDAATLQAVRAFASSLEPSAPHFFERRFRDEAAEQEVLARAEGEEPVLRAHLMAVELVLEAGVGARFPLSTREAVRKALHANVREGGATARASYRETHAALGEAEALPAEERLAGMRALGKRALQALLERATSGYRPAANFAGVWQRVQAIAVGDKDDGLTVGDVQCLHELCAFLVSLGADRDVPTSVERGDRIAEDLKKRWSGLEAAERDALRETGRAWAALRRDWDRAPDGRRDALRYALLRRVIAPGSVPGKGGFSPQAMFKRMRAVPNEEIEACVLRAAAMPAAERTLMLRILGGEASGGWELGW